MLKEHIFSWPQDRLNDLYFNSLVTLCFAASYGSSLLLVFYYFLLNIYQRTYSHGKDNAGNEYDLQSLCLLYCRSFLGGKCGGKLLLPDGGNIAYFMKHFTVNGSTYREKYAAILRYGDIR